MKGFVVLLVTVLLPMVCFAQDSLNMSILSELKLWERVNDVAVQGDYVFAATKQGAFAVNVSNPDAPEIESYVPTNGWSEAVGIRLFDNLLVVVTADYWYESGVLSIIQIEEPFGFELLAAINTNGVANGVSIQGSWLTFVDWRGLQVYSISYIDDPRFVTSHSIHGLTAIRDSLLYLSDYNSLEVLRFIPPDILEPLGTYSGMGFEYEELVFSGHYAYWIAGDEDDRIAALDLSDPSSPQTTAVYEAGQRLFDLSIAGDYLYAVGVENELLILDISTPGNLTLAGSTAVTVGIQHVSANDGFAYVSSHAGCVQVIDATIPNQPSVRGGLFRYGIDGSTIGGLMNVSGNTIVCRIGEDWYYSQGNLGFIDISDLRNPQMLEPYPLNCRNIAIQDEMLYVAGADSGIHILDISDVANVQEVGHYYGLADIFNIDVEGDYLYAKVRDEGLYVLDVANPEEPVQIGFSDATPESYGVLADGNTVVIRDGLYAVDIYDVTNPAVPLYVSVLDSLWIWGMSLSDGMLGMGNLSRGYYLVDVHNPAEPISFGLMDRDGDHSHIMLSEDRMVTAGDYRVRCFDISNPANPQQTGYYQRRAIEFPAYALHGNYLFEGSLDGLTVYDVSETIDVPKEKQGRVPECYEVRNFPNPFNPVTEIEYEIAKAGDVSLKVYDVLGREVANLVEGVKSAGNYTVQFDGANLPSGVYIYRLQAGEFTQSRKMVLLK